MLPVDATVILLPVGSVHVFGRFSGEFIAGYIYLQLLLTASVSGSSIEGTESDELVCRYSHRLPFLLRIVERRAR